MVSNFDWRQKKKMKRNEKIETMFIKMNSLFLLAVQCHFQFLGCRTS